MIFKIEWESTLSGTKIIRTPETVEADTLEQARFIFLSKHPNIFLSEITNIIPIVKKWSLEKTKYFKECYDYIKENQPLTEPFGCEGKKKQAAWRESHGLLFVDPVKSNLSSWGEVLQKRGYIEKRNDGLWATTDLVWNEIQGE